MAWRADELIPVSALQHYAYCPRQCALIHIEQTFDENLFTLRGQRLHENVHDPGARREGATRILRSLPLWSDRLGLVGKADIVEVTEDGAYYPVEHKSGPRKVRLADNVQLCAQAICIEEMTGSVVPFGAIYHHASKRRREVAMTPELRAETEEIVLEVRALLAAGKLPPPAADARCRSCSLLDACLPFAIAETSRRKSP